jgi:serine/threonine protein kinase
MLFCARPGLTWYQIKNQLLSAAKSSQTANMADEPPPGYELVARGYTSKIFRIGTTQKVVKVLLDDEERGYVAKTFFDAERSVYERLWGGSADLPAPAHILKYYGPDPHLSTGLVLEFAERGSLWDYVWTKQPVAGDLIVKWARQAAEGFAFCHERGVLHRDIHIINLFLDSDLNLKIGDFGASSIDGAKGLMRYRETHQLWVSRSDNEDGDSKPQIEISVRSEVFALGSTLYQAITGHDPMQHLLDENKDDEVKRRMQIRDMPSTDKLRIFKDLISSCWNLEYENMEEVLRGIRNEKLD